MSELEIDVKLFWVVTVGYFVWSEGKKNFQILVIFNMGFCPLVEQDL